MSEKLRPEFGTGGEKPKSPEAEKGEEKIEYLKPDQIVEHLAGNTKLQQELFGKVLSEEELKQHISARVAIRVMESIGLRPLTLDEMLEAQGATEEERKSAAEWMRKMETLPPTEKKPEDEQERVRDFSVVELFEEVRSVLAKELPSVEEIEEAKKKFVEIEQIRKEYLETVWGLKGQENMKKAMSGKLSLWKGGKDEITLMRPDEFFDVKARLEMQGVTEEERKTAIKQMREGEISDLASKLKKE